MNSESSSGDGGIPSALYKIVYQHVFHKTFTKPMRGGIFKESGREGERVGEYIMARLTSPMDITPSFSPFFSCANSAKASRISCSSPLVMLCSFASLDRRFLGVMDATAGAGAGAGARRLAG